jgi:4-amino-4-deoxy-L-arabinose transferase-like glycosyltransferase
MQERPLLKIENFPLKHAFLFIVVIFLFSRLTILLTSIESVSWFEELYRGTVAQELIDGLKAPLFDYQGDHYDGGSLVIGMAAVPFFLLLGPNLLALKLVPLLFSLVTLTLLHLFLKRFFNERTALFGSLLFALSPPVFTRLTLVAIGSHPESMIFSIAILFCFYSFLYEPKNNLFFLISWGFLSGFGCWYTSITGITLICALAAWPWMDRRSLTFRHVLIFSASFLAGFAPWIAYNLTHEFKGLDFIGKAFLWDPARHPSFWLKFKSVPVKIIRLLKDTLPFSFGFFDLQTVRGPLLSLVYYALTLFCFLKLALSEALTFRSGDKRLLPLLFYPLFFIFAYSLSNYGVFDSLPISTYFVIFKYFTPFYFFLIPLSAIAIDKARNPALLLIPLLLLGIIGQTSLFFQEPFGRALYYKGASYYDLGKLWGAHLFPFPEKFSGFQEVSAKFSDDRQRLLYWGYSDASHSWKNFEPKRVLSGIRNIPNRYQSYFMEAWGYSLSGSEKENDSPALKEITALLTEQEKSFFYYGLAVGTAVDFRSISPRELLPGLDAWPAEAEPFFYYNFGRSLYYLFEQKGRMDFLEIAQSLDVQKRSWLYKGLGQGSMLSWLYGPLSRKPFESLLETLSDDHRLDFAWGMGWALREELMEDPVRAHDWIKKLSPPYQAGALAGFQAFEKWYNLS